MHVGTTVLVHQSSIEKVDIYKHSKVLERLHTHTLVHHNSEGHIIHGMLAMFQTRLTQNQVSYLIMCHSPVLPFRIICKNQISEGFILT